MAMKAKVVETAIECCEKKCCRIKLLNHKKEITSILLASYQQYVMYLEISNLPVLFTVKFGKGPN